MGKDKREHRRPRTLSDPFAAVLRPPPDETPEQREDRLIAEQEAKKVSDGIDEQIRNERNEKKRGKTEVKVLLLGQSESGKSTTLKQFQLMHTPAAFHAERIAWRAVIYLNLVRSVRRILDAIAPEDALDETEEGDSAETASIIISANGRPASALSGTRVTRYDAYRRRLAPLEELEERLIRLLSSPDEDEPTHLGPTPQGWNAMSNGGHGNGGSSSGYFQDRPSPSVHIPTSNSSSTKKQEIAVHTTTNWKKAFSLGAKTTSPKGADTGEIVGWWEDPDDPVHMLNACAPVMMELWRDPDVRQRLKERRLRFEESSGFYLDEIPRITAKRYIPTDDDVLKARLKTLGVVEHKFALSGPHNRGVEWKIYDVGGARNQRQAWAPYFEDVNAIIFLAPISAFDQVLLEDPRVNRLEDTLLLWKSLVSNKLLARVNIVLFLNKIDLLQAKLNAGVRLNQHMLSYGDRTNDFDSVVKYFRNKFGAFHQSFSPNKERELFIHLTAVTDTRRTATIISNVRDMIVRANLRNLALV
ncbi:hypothetical protein PLICRDRAFT_675360 [Plicaturopsis crispa FD-325 SS-3]|nr:hypothetical protein PLICRDRAFT_675360 [Plicaturopsis crispa FD-325 SS-3]